MILHEGDLLKIFRCLIFPLLLIGCKPQQTPEEPHTPPAPASWTLDTFDDFIEGTFDDSGVNAYVAADGSLRLINQWDLTGDGYTDILLPNQHGENESTDFFIFLGKDNWDPDRRIKLPTDGGLKAAVADLNKDGHQDILLVNRFNGTKSELDLWIYWGQHGEYSPSRRTALPGQGAEAVAVGDLNGDGYDDIVLANSGLSYHVSVDAFKKSFIYWNRNGKFSTDDRTELPTIHARDVQLYDVNKDGHLDIVFANQGNEPGEGGVRIYINAGDGTFPTKNLVTLPGEKSSAVAVEDLDKNGWPDIVVANAFRLKGREGGIYDIIQTTHLNSYVYWGQKDGFSPNRYTALPTIYPQDISIGDVNQDGWLDVFFAQASGDVDFLYLGSAEGFRPNRRIAIPGQGHRSSAITDLDGDGNADLIVSPADSPDSTTSFLKIYWGKNGELDIDNPKKVTVGNTGGLVVADLDGDNRKDIVVVNRNDGLAASKSPAYLYTGDAQGFSRSRRIEIDTDGDDSYMAADLNADGYVDLFIPQRPPTIFWGSKDGFSEKNTHVLSSQYAFSGRAADFNKDGYLDIVVSEWSPSLETTHVYYGSPAGFSTAHRQMLPIRSVRFHTIADLNNDGWVDVLFPNYLDAQVVIFWNSPVGFDGNNKTVLSTRSAVCVEVADLNGDGYLDVIVPNLFDKNPAPGKTRSFGGSPEADTFIFWGGPNGPDSNNKTVLPSIGAEDAAVADLNKDGYLDLVLSSYHAGETRSHPSYIYWNGPNGFDAKNVTMIPTHSASGILIADFNKDGQLDIFFANHSKDGNHRNESWLYWSKDGRFTEDNRTSLPGIGPHLLTVADIGHVYHRGDHYVYTSAPHHAGKTVTVRSLAWDAETPFDTDIHLQVRAAALKEELENAPWSGPQGPNSYFTASGTNLEADVKGEWIQVRVELISPNGANSPIVNSISMYYE
jgi:hypothetical protein